MSRRVSAQELELRYKLKHLLYDFFDEMRCEMYRNLEHKGFSWKSCKKSYLLKKLHKAIREESWVDVGNYAFMLNDRCMDAWKKEGT